MPESWRTKRDLAVLGSLFLHNRGGVWWQSELEIVPGNPIRFDLNAEGAVGGIDSEELFAAASDFVQWARGAEPILRKLIVDRILSKNYLTSSKNADALNRLNNVSRDHLANLSLTLLQYFPKGESDWVYQCPGICERNEVGIMLGADREPITPVNVW